MSSITVIGEALVDVIRDGSASSERPGGGPANIALGIGRLGGDVELVTWLAHDARGRLIRTQLRDSDVWLNPASFGARRTSVAEVALDEGGHAGYRFDIEWEVPADLHPSSGWVHTGSIAAFLEPGAEKCHELVSDAARRGATVSFDPNIRPELIGDAQRAQAQFERFAALSAVVKLSDEDAFWLYPADSDTGVLDRLHRLGVRLAVLTRGQHGSVLSTATDRVHVPSTRVDVVDTIGAGDSYMAALIWQLSEQSTISDLTAAQLTRLGRFSSRASGITVGRVGADLPWLAELRHLAGSRETHTSLPA